MILVLKFFSIGCCALICYQDFKERLVYWFLFPLLGAALAGTFFQHTEPTFFLLSLVTNSLLVTLILGLLYVYSRFILKKSFVNHSLGIGDVLFFYAMALGFPPMTFVILFAGAVLFSLFSYLVIKKRLRDDAVPLAGFMGLYVLIIICCSFFMDPYLLYTT